MNIPLNIDWQQIVLHLLNFTILAGGLYFLIYKPVKDFMDKRIAYYQQMDDQALAKLSDAEKIRADYDKQLQNVQEEIAKREEESAKKERVNSVKELLQVKQEADKIIQDARQEAEKEHKKIIENAQKEVTDIVALAAKKLLLQAEDSEVFDQFLSLAERSVQDE